MLAGWAWLTSVTPAVIGRPSEDVRLQIRRDVGDVFYGVGDKRRRH